MAVSYPDLSPAQRRRRPPGAGLDPEAILGSGALAEGVLRDLATGRARPVSTVLLLPTRSRPEELPVPWVAEPNLGVYALAAFVAELTGWDYPLRVIDVFAGGLSAPGSAEERLGRPGFRRVGLPEDHLRELLVARSPEVVGIHLSHTCDLFDVLDLCQLVRGVLPRALLVLGGHHASACAESLLRFVDAVVVGEGEATFADLLHAVATDRPLSEVAGLAFRDAAGAVRQTPPRSLLPAAAIPWVARELYPTVGGRDVYSWFGRWALGRVPGGEAIATFQAGRGCPFADTCKHCGTGLVAGRRLRWREAAERLRELSHLAALGVRRAADWSDQVVLPRHVFLDTCDLLAGASLGLHLATPNGVSVDGMWALGSDGVERMVRAGYRDFCIALEGGADTNRLLAKRVRHIDGVREICAWIRGASPHNTIRFFIMVAVPGETPESQRRTLGLVQELAGADLLDQAVPFQFVPIPGTHFDREQRIWSDPSRWEELFNSRLPFFNRAPAPGDRWFVDGLRLASRLHEEML